MNRLFLAGASVFALSSVAACSAPSEVHGTTESAIGPVGVPGHTLASSRAKPGSFYLPKRNLETLEKLGAVLPTARPTLERIDGILGPTDGFIALDELVAIERPAFAAILSAADKVLLDQIWKWMEWSETPPSFQDIPLAPLIPTSEPLKDTSISSAPLQKPASLAIASLPPTDQSTLGLLETVYDSDGDPTTVSEVDLERGKQLPSPFTEAERDTFALTEDIFTMRAPVTLRARAKAARPFRNVTAVTNSVAGAVSVVDELFFTEKRERFPDDYAPLTVSLATVRQHYFLCDGDTSDKLLFVTAEGTTVHLAQCDEPAQDSLGATSVSSVREVLVERWHAGQRVSVGAIRTSDRRAAPGVRLDWRQDEFANFDIETDEGPLYRNLQYAIWDGIHGNIAQAEWRFEVQPSNIPISVSKQAIVDALKTPMSFPPGSYPVLDGHVDIFPQGAIALRRGAVRTILEMDKLSYAEWGTLVGDALLRGPSALIGPGVFTFRSFSGPLRRRDG